MNKLYLLLFGFLTAQAIQAQGFDPCDTSNGGPGCTDGGAAFLMCDWKDSVPYNTPFELIAGAMTASQQIDTSYSANLTVTISGPGTVSGTLSGPIDKWFYTDDVIFDTEGEYSVTLADDGILGDFTFNVICSADFDPFGGGPGGGGDPGGGTPGSDCNNATHGDRVNLGLYGGSSLDLTFAPNGRLFAAISSPLSLFQSDDTAKTWYASFPFDSLEYDCNRGWGGRAMKVLTNQTGWVAVLTSQEAGTLTASVINFNNGDTAQYQTAYDNFIFNELGFNTNAVRDIALSDYYLYVSGQEIIGRLSDTDAPSSANVIRLSDFSNMPTGARAKSLAVTNDPSGYPFYAVIDSTGDINNSTGDLFMYNGSAFTAIAPPAGIEGIKGVFVHPNQASADTVFINTVDMGGNNGIYRSTDGGSSWTDITPAGLGMWALSDVDYSPSWSSIASSSNGIALIIPGFAISYDMGNNWTSINLQNNGGAVLPSDPNIVVGTMGRGVVKSTTGAGGPYAIQDNYGLEAVAIKQIDRTPTKGVVYIATGAGLAYTTAYSNNSVANFDKWNSPHGEFPIANVGDDAGVFCVAIDPADSNHVVAGYSNGFAVTYTGPTGFSNVMPTDWNNGTMDPRPLDVKFINSNEVIALTGGDNQMFSGAGNIWLSNDGGQSWSKTTPTGFSNGNAIAVGTANGDTVIYVGAGLEASTDPADNGALWMSNDKGVNWTKINSGPTSLDGMESDLPILDVAVDPRSNDTLYIASGRNLSHAFVKSVDGGVTYETINISGEGAFSSVMINESFPDTVYTAIRREIYVYVATNDTVLLGFRGLPGENIPDLRYGSVIAGTSQGAYLIGLDEEGVEGINVNVFEPIEINDFILYPNPTEGIINIQFSQEMNPNIHVAFVDLLGRKVKESMISSNGDNRFQIDAGDIPSGTYLIILNDGERRYNQTFIMK